MLFLESKTLRHVVDGSVRIKLLEELQQKGLTSIIRTARLNSFSHLLFDSERTREMETSISAWTESENRESYVRGDLFSLSDHIFFLIFDDNKGEAPLIRAGIVYETGTSEPFRKLGSFCRDIRELLLAQRESRESETGKVENFPGWEQGKPTIPEGFRRFVAGQDADSLYTSLRKETRSKRILAASELDDERARVFLRSASDAYREGYAAKLLSGDLAGPYEFSIEKLENVGLVEREVQISCRKTGHALFRLPNAHALAIVTISDATCSECGSPVVDEKVEEVIAPTQLASSLLEDGSWLVSRLHFILREMGVPESEIAVGPSDGTGHGQMMVNLCGESFLLLTRDGDLTPTFARWAIDLEIETEASSHLVVVATGRLHNEARLLLHNHARRRISGGQDFELILADDVAAAGRELQYALERVSLRVIGDQVCDLDGSMGLSVSRLIITKFKLLRTEDELDHQHLWPESGQNFSFVRAPLTLAAHASANSGEIFDVGNVPDESSDSAHAENTETPLNSGTHGSWE
ncbi:MAG: hypothetical protein ACR2H4_20315 [Pyrinomonadaceae bacterium]